MTFGLDENLFFEMDNLDALFMLRETHLNKIKCIYIDPPYNTGNKQSYHDKRTHNEWKSFMYPRLYLARDLLSDDGVIFISIDDNEQHHLRCICDEIFGEGNFVGLFIWKNKWGGGNDSSVFVTEHEYIVIYSKCISILPKFTKQSQISAKNA